MQNTAVALIIATSSGASAEKHAMFWTPLAGRCVLARTISVFENAPRISSIVLLVDAGQMELAVALCGNEGWNKIISVIAGGPHRQETIHRGLDAIAEAVLECAWLVISDGDHPFVTPALLEAGLQAAQAHLVVTAAVPAKETIKLAREGQVSTTLDRSQLWLVQPPQAFSYPLLHQAYHPPPAQEAPQAQDAAALLEHLGRRVVIFPGSYTNIKIATPQDLLLAEAMLEEHASL